MITYAVINESTIADLDAQVTEMMPAMQDQWNNDLAPVWGLEKVVLIRAKREDDAAKNRRWCVFLDDSDQAGALAYHDLTADGMPICKIFARTILQAGEPLSVATTHELVESAVDPWLNSAYQDPQGNFWAGEVADPVEDAQYAYAGTGGVTVTDWIYPSWFGHQHDAAPYDFRGHLTRPFQIISGGYAQRFDPSYGWQQLFGREVASYRHMMIPGSRRERRARGPANWRRSAVHI